MSGKSSNSGIVVLTNSTRLPMRVILEPWADEHVLEPGASVDVAVSGPPHRRMEVEVKDGEILLYASEGAIMSVQTR